MCVTEVGHVDIVADTGPVVRVVVGPVDRDIRTLAQRGLDHQRDQVRLRLVPLAELTIRVGAGGVEVPERGAR